jgi:2-methylcitrate dehydratase PrpD
MICAELMECGGHPQTTVIGRSRRAPALSAALANGVSAHDDDDVTRLRRDLVI